MTKGWRPKENSAGTETVEVSRADSENSFESFDSCVVFSLSQDSLDRNFGSLQDNYLSMKQLGFCKSKAKGLVLKQCFHLAFVGVFCV